MSEINCGICLNEIRRNNNCVTECGHVFCFKCITIAMKYRATCPMCRTKLFETVEPDSVTNVIEQEYVYEESEDDPDLVPEDETQLEIRQQERWRNKVTINNITQLYSRIDSVLEFNDWGYAPIYATTELILKLIDNDYIVSGQEMKELHKKIETLSEIYKRTMVLEKMLQNIERKHKEKLKQKQNIKNELFMYQQFCEDKQRRCLQKS